MLKIVELQPPCFADVLALALQVHGENYLDDQGIAAIYEKSIKNDVNASLLAYEGDRLVGFRLTYAPGSWALDQWCTPSMWHVAAEKVCYFKSSAVCESMRGKGIGRALLTASIERVKQQGARAGIAHVWRESPGNSAFMYFSRCGAQLVKDHPDKWHRDSVEDGYCCPVCPGHCHCTAAEMIIYF